MISQVLKELQPILCVEKKEKGNTAFGNSNMIASCLQLLAQYQQQTKLVSDAEGDLFKAYMQCANFALKHTNPQVRKQAEQLCLLLCKDFDDKVIKSLVDQKPAVVQKIQNEAKLAS